MRGKRMEMPSAVCISDLENSAPVISHTGAFWGDRERTYVSTAPYRVKNPYVQSFSKTEKMKRFLLPEQFLPGWECMARREGLLLCF